MIVHKIQQKQKDSVGRALEVIRSLGGLVRTSEALKVGIHPRTLYHLRDQGYLETISRGVFRLAGAEPLTNPDLLIVATRAPNAVLCLVSALSFHELTTQVPHEVALAIPRGRKPLAIDFPPVRFHSFSEAPFRSGIMVHNIDGVDLKIYDVEKTLVDCFKFRNTVGMDVVLEALQTYRAQRAFEVDKILDYAKVCRVQNVMRPYLEMLL